MKRYKVLMKATVPSPEKCFEKGKEYFFDEKKARAWESQDLCSIIQEEATSEKQINKGSTGKAKQGKKNTIHGNKEKKESK